MTRELEALREQLERATSHVPPSEGALDCETAALREGWLSLCESLAAADTAWDDGALVNSLAREEQIARRASWWSFTLALSLVGIVIGAFAWLDRLAQDTAQHVEQVAMTRLPDPSALGASLRPRRPAGASEDSVNGALPVDNATPRVWNDQLDAELMAAQETLVSIRAAWGGPTDQVGLLSERLEELRSELDDESL